MYSASAKNRDGKDANTRDGQKHAKIPEISGDTSSVSAREDETCIVSAPKSDMGRWLSAVGRIVPIAICFI